MNMKFVLTATVVLSASASSIWSAPIDQIKQDFNRLQATKARLKPMQRHVVPIPMHLYKDDCGRKASLPIKQGAAALLQKNVPGAGIDKFTPFETVLKDGFLLLDCVKDYMYYRGDKYGDNKHDYKLGPVSNVSIVHYDAFVAKEDRVDMTQKVCFEFCRTVPNMAFFGIVNGRGCYCTPYFTPMESDSSQCDANCDGDNTLMCGGKSKSSIFAMHMCDSTEDDLMARVGSASELESDLSAMVKDAHEPKSILQVGGDFLQKAFGAVGDSGAANWAQLMKVTSGKIEHMAEDATKAAQTLGDLARGAEKLTDFTDPATVTKAERTMEAIEEALAVGIEISDKFEALSLKVEEPFYAEKEVQGREGDSAAKQYYPVMYFVDKEYVGVPSTCSGDQVGEVVSVGTADGCAAACDAHIHDCVGYQLFHDVSGYPSACILLSNFKTGFYYTGCGKSDKAFLGSAVHEGETGIRAACFAKLSKFESTTLKPDPSGKCKQCFKDLTKADRCYVGH